MEPCLQNRIGEGEHRCFYFPLSWKGLTTIPFDHAALERLRAGDAETERLFDSHFSDAIHLAMRRRLRSRELAEEIRKETFQRVLIFLRSDRGLDRPEMLGAYVHSVSINVMVEMLRSSSRHPPLPEAPEPAQLRDGAVTEERKKRIKIAFEKFSESDRRALRAVFLDEPGAGRAAALPLLARFEEAFRAA